MAWRGSYVCLVKCDANLTFFFEKENYEYYMLITYTNYMALSSIVITKRLEFK